MTHATAVLLSQLFALALFGSMFLAVLAYVFWPSNRKRFEEASRMPLDTSNNDTPMGA